MKKLFIASDHAGFQLKSHLLQSHEFKDKIVWQDLGPQTDDRTDYPDWADRLCGKILEERNKKQRLEPCGILICGSGVGMSMAANRHEGIRAALAFRPELARASREHNASNVLCLGERFISKQNAVDVVKEWLAASFEGGRHETRIKKIDGD